MQGRRHGRGMWTPLKPGKMQEGEGLLIIIAVSCFLKHILRNVFYFQVSEQLLEMREINHA